MPILPIAYFIGTHPILSHLRGATYSLYTSRTIRRSHPKMSTRFHQFDSINGLREFILLTISEQYLLQIGAYPITERILHRGGTPCGIYFCLHGPRSTKYSAIWETDHNRILFYGSRGERFQKTQLLESPRLECAAA